MGLGIQRFASPTLFVRHHHDLAIDQIHLGDSGLLDINKGGTDNHTFSYSYGLRLIP